MFACMSGSVFDALSVSSGVPQGSVRSPRSLTWLAVLAFSFHEVVRLLDELSLYCRGSWIIWLGKHGGEHFPVGRHATQSSTWRRNGRTELGLGRQTGWILVPHL